jgi:RNA recognition motif-containing protein
VGDLGPEVSDDVLFNTFAQHYPSCRTAKVVTDAVTGLSRGYGFVRFTEESEQQRAMLEMQGQFCGARPMRISVATPKNRFGNLAHWTSTQPWASAGSQDPSNTTVFVGGLTNGYVSEEELVASFSPFGPITYVKIPPGKGCGFVSFVHRQSAEAAIAQLNGSLVGTNRIRLSWGRNSTAVMPSQFAQSGMMPPQAAMQHSHHQMSQQQQHHQHFNSGFSLTTPTAMHHAYHQPPTAATQNLVSQAGNNPSLWTKPTTLNTLAYTASSPPRSPERLYATNQSGSMSTPSSPFAPPSHSPVFQHQPLSATPSGNANDSSLLGGGFSELDHFNWRNESASMTGGGSSSVVDPIMRPATSFANPLPSSSLGYRSIPSLFGALSAPSSPETRHAVGPHHSLDLTTSGSNSTINTSTKLSDIWG